ncbi:uncharacterized protein LOC123293766 [Chrysoperla carnea]|uniref:uncharacterized protein LOC123293766 n=1 Tax=Chrysoperla carnea TaxID=189513 RepID=UPI001D06B85C|nr:uncharacterized protein LOC123293766 [Chrysoperla carnea]
MAAIKILFSCLIASLLIVQIINGATTSPRNIDSLYATAAVDANSVLDQKNRVLPASEIITAVKPSDQAPVTEKNPLADLQYPKPIDTSTIAKFFTDIFQIPISVLQAVANLLSNPFRQRPETSAETLK